MDSYDIFKKLSKGAHFKRKANCISSERNEASSISTPEVKKKKKKLKQNNSSHGDVPTGITLISGMGSETENKKVDSKSKSAISEEEKAKKIEEENIAHLRNVYNITVKGKNVPPPIESFEELGEKYISGKVMSNVLEMGYTTPTPIQMQAIPVMATGRQILAYAPTGSGKTAAFLVPILSQLGKPSKHGFRALILCPTRELTKQIYRECLRLVQGTGLKPHIVGKVSDSSSKFGPNFSKKFDILVSTPNRLIFLLRREESPIDLKSLEWLVIDESDKLFEAGVTGFRNQLAEIYRACDSNKLKRGLFSATHIVQLESWCKKNLSGLVTVTAGIRNTAVKNVKQELLYVGEEYGKLVAFRNLIQEGLPTPALVFVQSKERAKELFEELILDGIYVDVIHADRPQVQRDNVVKAFREGKVWVLICTELMGRGIDFKGVKLVVNYDFPQSVISYIHRVGRTGRAGKTGRAITFFTKKDQPLLKSIARVVSESGNPVPDYMLKLKQPKRSERRKLESSVPERENITVSLSKRRKLKKKKVDKRTADPDSCIANELIE